MKNVLITGGSGSFGNAMAAKLLALDSINRVVIYSRGEHLQEQMQRRFTDPRLRFFIGDVRDVSRLTMAMRGIDTVFHAAALKIVPTAEYNPTECIETNVRGAENVVRASLAAQVAKVIALSTDKACAPTTLYGVSKLCAEKIFVAANALAAGDCVYSVVRYGNVVGSQGSVVPLFRSLAKQGSSLPITDTRMTRFWMTMNQAIDFVLYASHNAKGREIFIPKLPSVRIMDVAEAIAPGATKDVIGIRANEKIHESLVSEDESRCTTTNGGRGYVITPNQHNRTEFRYSSDNNSHFLTVDEIRGTL